VRVPPQIMEIPWSKALEALGNARTPLEPHVCKCAIFNLSYISAHHFTAIISAALSAAPTTPDRHHRLCRCHLQSRGDKHPAVAQYPPSRASNGNNEKISCDLTGEAVSRGLIGKMCIFHRCGYTTFQPRHVAGPWLELSDSMNTPPDAHPSPPGLIKSDAIQSS
jgi:hypothetical protein